jgi:energy-coupling factor transporter ATP-binding protein EcfA2
VKLDGNVHFIGTQGVGKSTLLRALLFFYNADKLRLGIPKEKKSFDAFYFPYPNSYIVYEVMRENGAYCVLALKNQGRVMFRFIDAPFDSKWFIDERKLVYGEWSQIREQVGKKHDISSLVSSYEMYRDIIFGNNRRQELLPFRKYAIVESAKYQNIPRTIQNVFLNTNLDKENSLMFIDILKKFKALHKTVIIATHDTLFDDQNCIDRYVHMRDGEFVE